MKILLAASDLTPLISPDPRRQADAVCALPVAFQRAGHEVSLVGPLRPAFEQAGAVKLKPTGVQIAVALGEQRLTVQVAEARSAHGIQMFLFRHEGIFGQPAEEGAPMNAAGAALFSKGIVELARRLNPAPDVIQIHDWPGALAPLFLKTQHLPFPGVLTLADPSAQGSFPIEDFGLLNLGWEHFRPTGVEFYGRLNFLKSGLLAARALVADGELEAAALQTSEHGGGLDAVLRENADKLHGIPAGLDESTWNPAKDPHLSRRYGPANLAGKLAGRNAFLAGLGLARDPAGPVYLLDLATAQDKALLGLLAGQLDQVLAADLRLVVLGAFPAQTPVATVFQTAARKLPAKLVLVPDADDRRRHLALAGADFQLFLGNDLHASGALLQAMKYGTLPIAPAGAGLRQLVEDHQPGTDRGEGLVFYRRTREALFDVLAHRAPALLTHEDTWESLRQRVMIHAGKFTWARTAAQYITLYGRLV